MPCPRLAVFSLVLLSAFGCRTADRRTEPITGDLVARLVAWNDAAMPARLARQQRDRSASSFGGIRASNGLYHAGAASGFVRDLAAAYVSPASRYAGSGELLAAIDDAATFLLRSQHDDGTIDLITTNFHSPPDTGFVLEWVCTAATVLQQANDAAVEPVLQKLLTFIRRGADALAVGGIHTPNHRWVVCMALARANALLEDPRYVERVDTWLAENIDIDPDGQFTERSTSIYSPLTNRCLITVARLLDRPALLDAVRRNLEMSLYYMHKGGQIATEGSRRQDQYKSSTMLRYYYPYRYFALHDGDARFAAVVRQIERREPQRLTGQLAFFLESPELADPLPRSGELPTDYERHFPHSDLVRIRRDDLSATILADNPTFCSLHIGSAAVAMRFASAFFGKGQFVGGELHEDGDAWVMHQDLTGPYYQPIDATLRRPDGDWHRMPRDQRPQSEVQHLRSTVRIRERDGGLDVELELTGTEGVPVAIELACPAETTIAGALPVDGDPERLLLPDAATLSIGDDRIRVRGGQVEHEWVDIRGALPKVPGRSIYVTGFTPLRRTLEFRR